MATFSKKKFKILSQLAVPDEVYTDASPKGSVDAPIRALVDEINAVDTLVTTSSCSGRIAIYAEGTKKATASLTSGGLSAIDGMEQQQQLPASSSQGKGGGAWLYVSHTPLTDLPSLSPLSSEHPSLSSPSFLSHLLAHPSNEIYSTQTPLLRPLRPGARPSSSSIPQDARLVHLKFEPLILHVLCANLDAARRLLNAASGAGFRESGVSGLPRTPAPAPLPIAKDECVARADGGEAEQHGQDGEQGEESGSKYPRRERKSQRVPDEAVPVAIRTMGLGMDAPVGYVKQGTQGDDGDAEEVVLCVGDAYLASLVALANGRFAGNEARKERLRSGIRAAFVP